VNGTVGGSLVVGGEFGEGHGSLSGSTSFTLGSSGSVADNLYLFSHGNGDSVDIAGKVSGRAVVRMFGNYSTATVEDGASIGERADFAFGNGTDSLTLAGTIGTTGNTGTALTVTAGRGANTVQILGTAVINGDARLRLGSGANVISLHDAATVTGTFALRAGNASAFDGSVQPNHKTLDLSAFKGTQNNGQNP
jgi:hypothetical protein